MLIAVIESVGINENTNSLIDVPKFDNVIPLLENI